MKNPLPLNLNTTPNPYEQGLAGQHLSVALREHATLLLLLFAPQGQKSSAGHDPKTRELTCSKNQLVGYGKRKVKPKSVAVPVQREILFLKYSYNWGQWKIQNLFNCRQLRWYFMDLPPLENRNGNYGRRDKKKTLFRAPFLWAF